MSEFRKKNHVQVKAVTSLKEPTHKHAPNFESKDTRKKSTD
jgi:hypothetical protein